MLAMKPSLPPSVSAPSDSRLCEISHIEGQSRCVNISSRRWYCTELKHSQEQRTKERKVLYGLQTQVGVTESPQGVLQALGGVALSLETSLGALDTISWQLDQRRGGSCNTAFSLKNCSHNVGLGSHHFEPARNTFEHKKRILASSVARNWLRRSLSIVLGQQDEHPLHQEIAPQPPTVVTAETLSQNERTLRFTKPERGHGGDVVLGRRAAPRALTLLETIAPSIDHWHGSARRYFADSYHTGRS